MNSVSKASAGTEPKDVTDEIDALVEQSASIDDGDIYAQFEFSQKLLALTQRQAMEHIDRFTDLAKEYDDVINKYYDLVQKYSHASELVFMGFNVDPVSTLEILLHDIDRALKIEDQSGESWKWGLRLTFWHRLKIAWKLIFKPSIKEGSSDA